VLAAYDLPAGARLLETGVRARWVRIDLVRLMRLSLPLGVTAMLISLSTMIPRYFIEHFRGEQELGAFVAMTSLTVVGGTVVNALGQAVSPRLARYYAAGDRASVRRVLVGVVGLAVVMGGAGVAVAMVWGRQILTALYRPEYAEHVDAFTLIMVAAGFSYVAALLGHAMTSARLFRVQMPLFAGVAAAALVACAGWVPANGLIGAAQANVVTVVANLLGVAAVHVYASRHSRLARRIERGLYRREPGPDPSRV
jgi:O-antigen/teichoic acid export membrane protein